MRKNLSRRDFLTTAALGAGVAAFGTMAGCAPTPAADGGKEEAGESAGSALNDNDATPIATVEAPAAWDAEADVLVVGTGGAGLNCSYIAADAGLSVIAIDKNSQVGGATLEATFWMAPGSRLCPWDSDDPYFAAVYGSREAYIKNFEPCDIELITTLIDRGAECMDWMLDLGANFVWTQYYAVWGGIAPDNDTSRKDYVTARMMKPAVDFMKGLCDQKGVQFRLNTQALALVKQDGRVIGVQAKDESGETIHIKGAKAVLLATGGMANNRAMLKEHIPTAYKGCASTCIMPTHTGEGIRMAQGAGADLTGFDTYKQYDGGLDYLATGTGPYYRYMFSGDSALVRQPWLTVNADCKRFMASGSSHAYEGMKLGQQPGNRGYVFFDADFEDNVVNKLNPGGSMKPILPEYGGLDRLPETVCPHDWMVDVNHALEAGVIKKADTLEELAEMLGLDPAKLAAAVDEWNDCCEKGEDPVWSQNPATLLPIAKAPFYGAAVGGWIWHSCCGVRVNPDMQALGADGAPIPGLYAAGQTMGGDNGYLCSAKSGPLAGLGLTFVTGYLAGQHIIANA